MNGDGESLRVMLGFVVRQCWRALGQKPCPEAFAEWANNQRDERGDYCIFGRAINADEARVIMRNPGRMVTVRPGPRWNFVAALSAQAAQKAADGS